MTNAWRVLPRTKYRGLMQADIWTHLSFKEQLNVHCVVAVTLPCDSCQEDKRDTSIGVTILLLSDHISRPDLCGEVGVPALAWFLRQSG